MPQNLHRRMVEEMSSDGEYVDVFAWEMIVISEPKDGIPVLNGEAAYKYLVVNGVPKDRAKAVRSKMSPFTEKSKVTTGQISTLKTSISLAMESLARAGRSTGGDNEENRWDDKYDPWHLLTRLNLVLDRIVG